MNLGIVDFFALGLIATGISIVLQYLKNRFGSDSAATKIVLILISVVFAVGYWLVRDTAIWVNIVEILTIASTVYAIFIKDSSFASIGK